MLPMFGWWLSRFVLHCKYDFFFTSIHFLAQNMTISNSNLQQTLYQNTAVEKESEKYSKVKLVN